MTAQMSREELLALPPTTDLVTLGRALGVSEPTIRQWHHRGELDRMGIRVLRVGRKLRVVTADVWAVLGLTRQPPAADGQPGAESALAAIRSEEIDLTRRESLPGRGQKLR